MSAPGVWWKRLHTAGIDWLWSILALSYFSRLSGPELWLQGAVLCSPFIVALGLRIRAWAKARFRLVVV
jgi:methionine sulfoxide reductase heme-binding subunit